MATYGAGVWPWVLSRTRAMPTYGVRLWPRLWSRTVAMAMEQDWGYWYGQRLWPWEERLGKCMYVLSRTEANHFPVDLMRKSHPVQAVFKYMMIGTHCTFQCTCLHVSNGLVL